MKIFDLVGVGFGPANLALAIALHEEVEIKQYRDLKTVFLEAKPEFMWHPGLLLEDMSIQVSFLKDLVTLRNPCSRFTFLNYLKEEGRLDSFINLQNFFPTRLELNDYFRWAANQFKHQVCYGKKVVALLPLSLSDKDTIDAIEVVFRDSSSGQTESYVSQNLVVATGGRPKMPEGISIQSNGAVFHSSEFLHCIHRQYPNQDFPYRFVVVGSGQSGAEILYYLANHYPKAKVTGTIRGFGYRPMDDSNFVNEIFFPQEVDAFYSFSDTDRAQFLKDYHNSNYSVVDLSLIRQIYALLYKQKIKGDDRIKILSFLQLDNVSETAGEVTAQFTQLMQKQVINIECDALILATGYDHSNQHPILERLSPYLVKDQAGDYCLKRNYCLKSHPNFLPNIFLQGLCEKTHGFSDTLLSILPIRASKIVDSLLPTPAFPNLQASNSNDRLPVKHLVRQSLV
ncbi:MAG: lysine N(6)-hydroxylase/L-ornithine N(5)-oxygenase family protein [Nodosilinea sp.]